MNDLPVEPIQIPARLSIDCHSLIGQRNPSLAEGMKKMTVRKRATRDTGIVQTYSVQPHKHTVLPEPCFVVNLGNQGEIFWSWVRRFHELAQLDKAWTLPPD
jgi:hypothetical protein